MVGYTHIVKKDEIKALSIHLKNLSFSHIVLPRLSGHDPYNLQPTRFFKTLNGLVPETRSWPDNRGNTIWLKDKFFK